MNCASLEDERVRHYKDKSSLQDYSGFGYWSLPKLAVAFDDSVVAQYLYPFKNRYAAMEAHLLGIVFFCFRMGDNTLLRVVVGGGESIRLGR